MSIKNALYFSYDGIYSTDMKLINVNMQTTISETFLGNNSISEVSIRGKNTPYFQDTTQSPLSISLQFAFSEKCSESDRREVARWLRKKEYKELFFSSNIDRIFKCIPIGEIDYTHNGGDEGYLTLTMRCDSCYSYSQTYITPLYESGETSITIENSGDVDLYPEISIVKDGDGDIEIINSTNGNESFKFTDLLDEEDLYIDNDNKIIVTDQVGVYRYSNFNKNYLKLVYGVNILTIVGNATLQFRYRNKTLQG